MQAVTPDLLEREVILEAVDALLAGARQGNGGALFAVAEAGVGKSVVLQAARDNADGFGVGIGRGDGVEATLPYGILHQALAAIDPRSPLTRMAADGRAALFYAVLNRLETAATTPLLIALDDLQWADADSLDLVSVICRRITSLPVAVIGTMRPHPAAAHDMARTLAADGNARVIRLAPLSATATATLLTRRGGAELQSDIVDRAWRLTAGNPLLIEQAVAMLERDGGLPDPDAESTAEHQLLVGRFAGTGDDALQFARAASVLGVRFRAAVAGDIAGLDAAGVDAALESLARAGVVAAGSDGVAAFVHPLFRSALYDEIATPLRARWHGRAFALLAAAGAPVAEAAHQAGRADVAGDAAALDVLTRAGLEAIRAGAGAAAVRHLRAALRAGGDTTPAAVNIALAEALLLTGSAADAVTIAADVVQRHVLAGAAQVDALRMLGRASFYAGSLASADAAYDEAVTLSADRDDTTTAAEVALEYAAVALFAAGPAHSLPMAGRARQLVSDNTEPVAAAATLAWTLANILNGEAAPYADAVAAAATLRRHNIADRAASLAFFGAVATLTGDLGAASDALATAHDWATQRGDPVIISFIATATAMLALRCGDLAAADLAASRAVALGDLGPAGLAWAQGVAGEVLHHLGKDDESEAMSAAATALATSRHEWLPLLWADLTNLQRLRARGRVADAVVVAKRLATVARAHGIAEACFVPWAQEAVAVHAAASDFDAVAALVAEHEVASATCHQARVVVARGLAALAEHHDDTAAAAALLESAAAACGDAPLDAVRLLTEAGSVLRRGGSVAQGRSILGDAVRRANDSGAVWLAERATAELHVAGGRRRRRGEADELTAAERRVALLAADGLSNSEIAAALFLSPKTVDTHLQHTYAKLGINSRRDLIRRAAEFTQD